MSRRLLAAAAVCALALPLPALAATTSSAADLVVEDVAGDANGVNDQGEGLVRNQTWVGRSAPEADLLRVRLSSLVERNRVTGWSVAFRTAGDIGPHQVTGEELELGIVSQPTPDCRFSVTYRTDGARAGAAHLTDSGGCGTGRAVEALPVRRSGSLVRVDVPYRMAPTGLRSGVVLPGVSAFVRLAPAGGPAVGEVDNAAGPGEFRLPRAGSATR